MKSILEELYYGNINPNTETHRKSSTSDKSSNICLDLYEKLSTTLNESQKELLEKLLEAEGEAEELLCCNKFTYGVKFGALFMTEIFTGMNQMIEN